MKPLEGAHIVLWARRPEELAGIGWHLVRLGSRVEGVVSSRELEAFLKDPTADMVLAELARDFTEPLDLLLPRLRRAVPAVPLVVVVDAWDRDLYFQALARGCFDAVALPLDEKELVRITTRALESRVLCRTA